MNIMNLTPLLFLIFLSFLVYNITQHSFPKKNAKSLSKAKNEISIPNEGVPVNKQERIKANEEVPVNKQERIKELLKLAEYTPRKSYNGLRLLYMELSSLDPKNTEFRKNTIRYTKLYNEDRNRKETEIFKQINSLSSENLEELLNLYQELALLFPEEQSYKDKIGHYRDKITNWHLGGTLHKATLIQWKNASFDNKLATCADWLKRTTWKDSINSTKDFDSLKKASTKLVKGLDKAIESYGATNESITPVVAYFLSQATDIQP